MQKRSGKFYSKNEKETLKKLGLTPSPASGAGWVIKEDGENETLMVQLKSTDASSYRVNKIDLKKLEYHAMVSNKIPVFLVQFLQDDRLYAIVDVDNIEELYNGLKGNINSISVDKRDKREIIDRDIYIPSVYCKQYTSSPIPSSLHNEEQKPRKRIKTSKKSRDEFFDEKESKKKFKKF